MQDSHRGAKLAWNVCHFLVLLPLFRSSAGCSCRLLSPSCRRVGTRLVLVKQLQSFSEVLLREAFVGLPLLSASMASRTAYVP